MTRTMQWSGQAIPPALVEPLNVKHKNMIDTSHLKNRTQKAAFTLLQREDNNAKKGRLESLLQHQFLGKYGVKSAGSQINDVIKSSIHEYISSFVNTRDAESRIAELESEIKLKTDALKGAIRDAKRLEKQTREDEARQLAEQQLNGNKSGKFRKNQNPQEVLLSLSESEWPLVTSAMNAVAEERKVQEAAKQEAAKKAKLKAALDEQLAAQKRQEEETRQGKQRQLATVNRDVEQFQHEVVRQRADREQHLLHERSARQAQIEENKRLKEEERQARIAQEKAEIARARRLIEEEEELKRAQRDKQRAAQDKLFMENELNKRIKEQALREAQEADVRLTREYERKLEQEERAREGAFKARMDALAKFQNTYETKVGTRLQQQREDDERQRLRELEAKDRVAAERERETQERRRQRLQASTEENLRMMEEKRLSKERERMLALETRLRLEQDAADQRNRQREEGERQRLKRLEMKLDLDAQLRVSHDRRRKEKEDLLSIDRAAAAGAVGRSEDVLRALQQDPALMHKVLDRVQQKATARKATSIY